MGIQCLYIAISYVSKSHMTFKNHLPDFETLKHEIIIHSQYLVILLQGQLKVNKSNIII